MNTLIFMDIDGTIADATRRFKRAGKEPSKKNKVKYDAWVKKVQNEKSLLKDSAVSGMRDLCESLVKGYSTYLIYLTSREEMWYKTTLLWLAYNDFPRCPLAMRGNGDYSETNKLKESIIKRFLNDFSCINAIVIDDDHNNKLEITCKKNGWTFLKARSGGGDIHE